MSPHRQIAVLAIAIITLAGCGSTSSSDTPTVAPTTAKAAASPAAADVTKSVPPPVGLRILGYPAKANAKADIARAVATARKDRRFVLLDFGATWCVDCRLVERFWTDPGLTPVLDKSYHVVSIDVGEFDHNMALFRQYAPGAVGIPTFVLVSPEGKVLKDSGKTYVTAAEDKTTVTEFATFLRKWASANG